MMTRFEQEITGKLGDFWKRNAQQEVEKLMDRAYEIEVEKDGAAKWVSNGNYLPSDVCEKLVYGGFDFSPKATEIKRNKQTADFLNGYRNHKPTAEEMFEMRAAFGEGTTVVNVLTGEKIRL